MFGCIGLPATSPATPTLESGANVFLYSGKVRESIAWLPPLFRLPSVIGFAPLRLPAIDLSACAMSAAASSSDMRLDDAPMGASPCVQEEPKSPEVVGASPSSAEREEARAAAAAVWLSEQGFPYRPNVPWRPVPCRPRPKQACKVKGLVEKRLVWLGLWPKTGFRGSGVTALRYNRRSGRVVSRKMSHNAMVRYPGSKLWRWNVATKQARELLGCQGFVKMGKGEQGRQLLEVTRSIYNRLDEDCANVFLS